MPRASEAVELQRQRDQFLKNLTKELNDLLNDCISDEDIEILGITLTVDVQFPLDVHKPKIDIHMGATMVNR